MRHMQPDDELKHYVRVYVLADSHLDGLDGSNRVLKET